MLVFGSWGEVYRRSIQADLFISRISEKLDERSLYNKLSVLFMQSIDAIIECSTVVHPK